MYKTPWLLLILMMALPAYAEIPRPLNEAVSTSAIVEYLLGQQKTAADAAQQRESLQQQLALQDLVLAEAGKQGLATQAEVKIRLELARRTALVDVYWADYFSKHPIAEADLQDSYQKLKATNGNKQYRLSQIFVKSEAQAMQVLDKLKQKKSFIELVKEYSQDEATRNQGGDLGWQWKSNLTAPVVDALESLMPGDITISPVITSSGYVVLKLDEVREQAFPTFDNLRPTLEAVLRAEAQQEQLSRLRK